MITIPSLSSVDDILDSDVVMVTHSNGQTFKIPGTALNKRNQAVISANTTLTGAPLKTANIVRAYFTADLAAPNSSAPLTLSYNGVSYTVKVPKNGALANYLPFDVGGGVYKYLQAYTTLELLFDGTYFVVQGNPVVLSSTDYTIYPDGRKNQILPEYSTVITNYDLFANALLKINKIVMLDIEIYVGLMHLAQNTKTVIGQLPLGYYPATRLSFPIHNQNSGNGRVISSDFQIEISVYGEISIISSFTDVDFLHIHYAYIAA